MAKRKLSPLVQAMNLFAQLDERDKQTLADYIRSQTTRPKSTAPAAPGAGKKSSRRNGTADSTANTKVETVNASSVGVSGD